MHCQQHTPSPTTTHTPPRAPPNTLLPPCHQPPPPPTHQQTAPLLCPPPPHTHSGCLHPTDGPLCCQALPLPYPVCLSPHTHAHKHPHTPKHTCAKVNSQRSQAGPESFSRRGRLDAASDQRPADVRDSRYAWWEGEGRWGCVGGGKEGRKHVCWIARETMQGFVCHKTRQSDQLDSQKTLLHCSKHMCVSV